MNIIETGIPDLLIVESEVHGDERGFFKEIWKSSEAKKLGLPGQFVQANVSRSGKNIIRGLHYQYPKPQGKLVSVVEGRIFDVAVDIRPDSPFFGQWAGVELSAANHRQLYVPAGFAHGFSVLGDSAQISYLCTEEYAAEFDAGVLWNDAEIGVEWPNELPSLSRKDQNLPLLRDINPDSLPRMSS